MPWRMMVLMTGVSMTRIALVAQKSGRSIFESLKTNYIVVAVAAAGSASLALDSAPQPPSFRFPDVVVRSSEIHSVIATRKSLLASITVRG